MRVLAAPLLAATLLCPLSLSSTVSANPASRIPIDIGGGIRLDALGTYDVGKELDQGAVRNDLGPATLGFEIFAGIRPVSKLRIAGEFGLAMGGLVQTDERYYGERSNVGSTLTASAKASVGYSLGHTAKWRYRLGAVAGVERLSESTSLGYVRLDTVTGGVWFELGTAAGWALQARAEVHAPRAASIQGQVDGASVGGHYSTLGAGASYTFQLGSL